MPQLPWRKKKLEIPLSAYVDDELDNQELIAIGEHLVLDPKIRQTLDSFRNVKCLVENTLTPIRIPNSKEVSAGLWERLRTPDKTVQSLKHYGAKRRRNSAAMIASIGLLVTAGITFVGLRKRGLV